MIKTSKDFCGQNKNNGMSRAIFGKKNAEFFMTNFVMTIENMMRIQVLQYFAYTPIQAKI